MTNKILAFLTVVVMVACQKDELPIEPHDAGDALEVQIAMGQHYKTQIFYDLKDNAIVSTNDKVIWDLGFESSANGWHITLNNSKGMAVHRSDLNFDEVTDDTGLSWRWDTQTGNLDSTAVGDWQTENKLYVIDRGYDELGIHQGFYKMTIESVSSTTYQISCGDISDLIPQQQTITKNDVNLLTFFSFDDGVVTVAPPNETWDLVFTQYTHLFTNPDEAYIVTGTLLNRYNTVAAVITNKPFNDVVYADAVGLNYSPNLDIIGYSWKVYDFDLSVYTVNPNITYIIKTNEGLFYKLHFTDFYNSQGIKGYPKFEVQQL